MPTPSAPPAPEAHAAPRSGLDDADERALQEAIRRSLAEQQQAPAEAAYRPSHGYVPTATVVGHEPGPRLPTDNEAVGPRQRRR